MAIEILKEFARRAAQPGYGGNPIQPAKDNIIKAAMDKDLARVHYTMNLLKVKL